uniref:Uncharacterized protein n=1 Tax=Branchiostoma floridae TaxID=7739 RepID=C3Y6Q6_BRAFL|eukprot:XP_002608006.1 hypothetical protein BRAFLDRAFT_74958 [Branchiostoma floridae]
MSFRHIATLAVLLAVVIAAEGRPNGKADFAAAKKQAAKAESDQVNKAAELPKVKGNLEVNRRYKEFEDRSLAKEEMPLARAKLFRQAEKDYNSKRLDTKMAAQVNAELDRLAKKDRALKVLAAEPNSKAKGERLELYTSDMRDELYKQAGKEFEEQQAAKMTARVEGLERQFVRGELRHLAEEYYKRKEQGVADKAEAWSMDSEE